MKTMSDMTAPRPIQTDAFINTTPIQGSPLHCSATSVTVYPATCASPHKAAIGEHLTFQHPTIIYYGPHQCSNCGVMICKMGMEFGGNAFTYPEGPIYPNTEWHPHVCHPARVAAQIKP